MFEEEIIEKPCSERADSFVIVRKSSETYEYALIIENETTMKTSYPLPNKTEAPDKLAGASYFTSIYMVSGYHHIEVAEKDKEKKAFVCLYGGYYGLR